MATITAQELELQMPDVRKLLSDEPTFAKNDPIVVVERPIVAF